MKYLMSAVFNVNGRRVLVENMPALVGGPCGEAFFSRTTTELVRALVHGSCQLLKTVAIDVFVLS